MSHQQNTNALMQQLKKHFNLAVDLFSEESGFFFEGAQRQHNLETLRHMASFSDMVLFLTGDKGSGKTHLLKKILSSSFEGLNVIYLDCERLVHEGQGRSTFVLEACLSALGKSEKGGSSQALFSCLLRECHRLVATDGVRTLFAFDNADKLPRKELQEYCGFCKEMPAESALVMLFSGPSSLIQTSKLGSNLEKDIWFHQIQLKPLSSAEVLPYLEQSLALSGYLGKFELTELQVQQLVDLGKGLPGRINKLFPSVVLEPGLLKIKKTAESRGAPLWIMFGLAGLLVVSFLFVSYQHGLFDRLVPVFSLEDKVATESLVLNDEINAEKALDEFDRKQKSRIAMLDKVLREKGVSLPDESKSEELSSVSENIEQSKFDDVQEVEINSTIEEINEEKIVKLSLVGGLDSVLDKNDDSIQTPQQKVDERPIKIAQDDAESKVAVNLQTVEKSKFGKLVVEEESLSPFFRSKEWLQEQAEGAYLAQILGSYSEQTALKFIEKIGEQKVEVFYLKTEHKDKAWFVVFYGVFLGKSYAQDAVRSSPKLIKDQNPWIRRSAEVLASYPK